MGSADYTIRKGVIDAIPEGINISVKDLGRYIVQIEEIKKNLANCLMQSRFLWCIFLDIRI